MALSVGARIGPYEILSALGAGGMGEVYRATDTNLKRQVALKVLPDEVAADAERLARFQREAEVLAALNHPRIAQIYGLEKTSSLTALVMELVEGDDLSFRIASGPIPLAEALQIAEQIAEGLEAAHEQGIIHRDLKPANIMLRSDGMVKVLDFGLAKALDRGFGPGKPAQGFPENSPTITVAAMTAAGLILGTAAYMAPEQAKAKAVDRRADIWALGAVLYEMLTGRRAFRGEDTVDTIAAVLSKDPDWSALPGGTPASIRTLLRRCLEKNPKRRLDSAAAVRLEIGDALTVPAPTIAQPALGSRLPWVLLGTMGAAMAAVLVGWAPWRPVPGLPETRVEIVTPETAEPSSFALSPDGRHIVFAAAGEGGSILWVRSLAGTTARPLPGTAGATYPFWSPDGGSIGFFADRVLKRVDVGGSAPQTLAPAVLGRGATWNTDGDILFSASVTTALVRVPATGGAVVAATTLLPGQRSHRFPQMLPDGNRFLFTATGRPEVSGIYLGAFDGNPPARLTPADGSGLYLPSGWLAWVRAGTLVAQRLDLAAATLAGVPVTLADGVAVEYDRSAASVAPTGAIAYRTTRASQRQLTWFDRSGAPLGTIGSPDNQNLRSPSLSPDGRRVAVVRTVQGNPDIWLLDGARTSRLTFEPNLDQDPIWSPDGASILFMSTRSGQGDVYRRAATRAGSEEPLLTSDQLKSATAWSADGRYVLYHSNDPETDADLWVAAMPDGGPGAEDVARAPTAPQPTVLLKTQFREIWGVFSPDGRWVAYHSNESGRPEVYVRAFVAGTPVATRGQWQISTTGGAYAMWRPDGKELYYIDPSGRMMAAPVTVSGALLTPGDPVALFPTRILGGGGDMQGRQYGVAPDGRFLVNTVVSDAAPPITLVLNWHPEP